MPMTLAQVRLQHKILYWCSRTCATVRCCDTATRRRWAMTSTDVATYTRRATPDAQPTKVERKLTVTRKVKAAIDAMVWEGLKRADAAKQAGLAEHSLYVALTRPHVKQHYLSQCEVLRLSGRARRIHRLDAISEQDDNKQAAVNAIRALDNMAEDEAASTTRRSSPGVTIVIQSAPSHMAHIREIEAKPLISHDAGQPSSGEHD